jgi:Holliday junction resolvase
MCIDFEWREVDNLEGIYCKGEDVEGFVRGSKNFEASATIGF